MTSSTVAALPAASALDGTELYYSVQAAADTKVTGAQIKTWTSASPTLVTPTLGVAAGTSLALGGATIGGNAFAVTGTSLFNSGVTFSAAITYGGVALSNSVTGTGSMVLSAAPTITGHPTIEGVTSTGATGTGKFVFDGSPTLVTPTIGVAVGTSLRLGAVSTTTGQLFLANSASANLTTIQAGNAANARTYTWPTDFGSSGTVLTDAAGNGTLSWAAASASVLPLHLSTNLVEQYNSTTAQTFRVYNTFTDASNYERGILDWSKSSNIFSVGTEAAGTGTLRPTYLYGGTQIRSFVDGNAIMQVSAGGVFANSFNMDLGTQNASISRAETAVVLINNWMNWFGQKRITSDFNTGNSTTLTDITGLSVTLQPTRTYNFEAVIPTTSNVAAGVNFAIAGTATVTNTWYEAIVYSGGAVVVQTRAAALATSVGAITAVTAAYCRITGTVSCSVGGTLTVQFAQNVGNATGSVALRGGYFTVYDVA